VNKKKTLLKYDMNKNYFNKITRMSTVSEGRKMKVINDLNKV